MSGLGYPFPTLTLEQPYIQDCMLPSQVDSIRDYRTCTALLDNCVKTADLRSAQRHNPMYQEYSDWFTAFRDGDKVLNTYSRDGLSTTTFQGGCRVLLMSDNPECGDKALLWSGAKEQLRDQLHRFYRS